MVDDAIKAEIPPAASPATDEAAVLSELTELALGLARGFQAQGVAALEAGDLDRAGEAETRFSSLFLGIRRAIALKLKLREQREEAQREAAADKDRRQDEKDRRRRAVGERMSRAIAAERPEARERLTADLWERLAEDERIDADLADTALPIDVLIARLRRDLGLPPHRPGGAGPAGTGKASPAAGEARGTSGPPRDGYGASGPPAGAVAPPRSVPLPPAGGGQGGSGPPATAPPGADPAERQGREHDRRRLDA
ncbi:hypothetical protein [Inquilinus limosus]|uniref:Uncharacterized protein n=1 Tax=Inquilinus limosus TaxID=171674 RepID=A0A211ZLZ4_9PROT|nr:hypothetical protein [Inquilinus limosus]OWJ66194.1 hypothetical protein BWR60_15695 [Inquilinus limosus]